MRHLLSVFHKSEKRYNRKMAVVTTAIGMTAIMSILLLDSATMHDAIELHAEVAEAYIATSQTEKNVEVTNALKEFETGKMTQPTKCELAMDTLLGVPSVTDVLAKEDLYQMTNFTYQPNMEDRRNKWLFGGLLEKQEAFAEQSQELQESVEENEEENKEENKEETEEIIALSDKERAVLLRIVEAEATDEDVKGRMLVANVVLNRVNCQTEFPDNVTDVVFDRTGGVCQFSPIDDGRYWDVTISEKTEEAVHLALCGEDESEGALYFMERRYSDRDNVSWFDSNLKFLFRYGRHDFFRYKQ